MAAEKTLGECLRAHGLSRRGFLKFSAAIASATALPPTMVPAIAAALERARRPSVIWRPRTTRSGATASFRSTRPSPSSAATTSPSAGWNGTCRTTSSGWTSSRCGARANP